MGRGFKALPIGDRIFRVLRNGPRFFEVILIIVKGVVFARNEAHFVGVMASNEGAGCRFFPVATFDFGLHCNLAGREEHVFLAVDFRTGLKGIVGALLYAGVQRKWERRRARDGR